MRADFAAALALTAVLLTSRAAAAGDAYDEELRHGVELRRHGDDEQALQEFTKAYEASKAPRALAQMGLAEQALGRWLDAEKHLHGALQATSDPWIQKNGPVLRSAIETIAKHLGSLQVLGEPAGAEVLVQGKSVGFLPLDKSVRVANGEVLVELRHPGYRTTSRTATIIGGQLARETIVLLPLSADSDESAAALRPPPSAPPAAHRTDQPAQNDLIGGATTGTPWQRPAKWTAAGLAAVAVAVGVVETIVAIHKSNDFNSLPETCTDDDNGHITGGTRCEQVNHDQTVATWTAAIGYGVGGALAATAIILNFVETRPARGGVAMSPRCTVDGPAPGIACAIRW